MDILIKKFRGLCNTTSDINEHLPVLFRYAKQCDSALELGVRGCISSWAIASGLLENKNGARKRLFMNDMQECQIGEIIDAVSTLNIDVKYEWKSDLDIVFEKEEVKNSYLPECWNKWVWFDDKTDLCIGVAKNKEEAKTSKILNKKNYIHYCFHDEEKPRPCIREEI
jgi:hypothetical protein